MTPTLVMSLVALVLLVALLGVWQISRAGDRRRDLAYAATQKRESSIARFRRRLERRVMRTRRGRALRRALDRGDLSWNVADVVMVLAAGFLFVIVVSWSLGGPVGTIISVVALVAILRRWFSSREDRRTARFLDQMPELARLLSDAASAGLSLRAALVLAEQESPQPTKAELAQVNEELRLGAPLDDVMERWGERMPRRELKVLVNVLVIQSRAGGKIVTALKGISTALDVRRDLRREVDTLMAGSKATLYAVYGIWAFVLLLAQIILADGLRGYLQSPIGLPIFLVSLGILIFGGWLARRVLKVEV